MRFRIAVIKTKNHRCPNVGLSLLYVPVSLGAASKMSDYLSTEIVDMIMVLGKCDNNYYAATKLYQKKYPERKHPMPATLKSLVLRARHGYSKRQRHKLGPKERQSSHEFNVPRSIVSRVLRFYKFHPYHVKLTQQLERNDFNSRLLFCQWAQSTLQQDPSFFSYVLFSDEATFKNTGELNRHNCHYWSRVNPLWQRSVPFQKQWSLNVWAGIIGEYIIGPYFFDTPLTGQKYLRFLEQSLTDLLDNVDLTTRRKMWFQHDGAPVHYDRRVRNLLELRFPQRWIGPGSAIAWPPRSPDLTPLDFFLWGYVKEKVFSSQPTSIEDMKERISNAFKCVTLETLMNVQADIKRRIQKCIDMHGNVFEHL